MANTVTNVGPDEVVERAFELARGKDVRILIGVPDGIICPPDGWRGMQWAPYAGNRWEIVLIMHWVAHVWAYNLQGNQLETLVIDVEYI